MSRTKTGVTRRKRHIRVLKEVKGYFGARGTRYKAAHEALLHAGQHAYIGRRLKRRDLRSLWITRISIAIKEHGSTYSKFIKALKDKNIELDRKILSALALSEPQAFKKVVESTK